MNWDDVKPFLAAARAGQLKIAARRLRLSQATLARRIDRLESALGSQLLIREPRGCRLTDQGLALLPQFEELEAKFDAVEAKPISPDREPEGTVRIGTPDGFGLGFLAPRLGSFTQKFPKLGVQLVPAPQNFSLSQRDADIVIQVGRPERGNLIGRKLTAYTLGLYASQNYVETHGYPKVLEELDHHPLVGWVEDLVGNPSLNYLHDFKRNWTAHIEVASAMGQILAVQSGAGIGFLHHYLIAEAQGLCHILPQHHIAREYWIVWHSSQGHLARIREVINYILSEVEAQPPTFWRVIEEKTPE